MILDLFIIGIFVIATVRGKVSGFMEAIIRFLALVGALLLGVMGTGSLANTLYGTPLDTELMERFETMAEDGIIDLTSYMPKVLANIIGPLREASLRVTVRHFTNTVISVFAFLIIVVGVWLIASWVIHKLKKSRKEKGLIGSVDSSVGMVIGALKGAILVCLLLAFMFPVTGIFMPDKMPALQDQLNNSFLANLLYDINPILLFMDKLPL